MGKLSAYHQPLRIIDGLAILLVSLLAACSNAPPPATPLPKLADELIFYYWADYFPQSVLDDFSAAYGVKVHYVVYESAEEAAQKIGARGAYDLVIIAQELIPALVARGALAKIDYQYVPNFKNIAPNFRDLDYDPNNTYSIPFQWGTTGLLVRTDLVKQPITRWADLWNPAFAGKVALWPLQRDLIAIALKTLGYSANSENAEELEKALQQLRQLKKNGFFVSTQAPSIVSVLETKQALLGFGWTYDALKAEQAKIPIQYILPSEGTLLWGENYVIPASSQHRHTAETFLNFVLRPEVSAKIITENYSAIPNEPALMLLQPALRHDAHLFPPSTTLKNAELTLPLSPAGQRLWNQIWKRFLANQ